MAYPEGNLPFEFHDLAVEFLWTYRHSPSTSPPYWPRYFLLCHSVELILKAYIAARCSLTSDELKRDFGHNLEKLLDKAIAEKLPISASAAGEIKLLNEAHTKYWPRYPREEAKEVFVIGQFEAPIEELFKAVRKALGVSGVAQ